MVTGCFGDITLIVDSSGSIEEAGVGNWQVVKDFVKNIVRRLDVGRERTRVAGIIYSLKAYVRFNFNKYTSSREIISDIDTWTHLNSHTNTTGAFAEYLAQLTTPFSGQRSDVRDVIILITDGNTTIDRGLLDSTVAQVKNLGAMILGVGIGKIDLQEMARIVSFPFERNYFAVSEFQSLANVLDSVVQSTNCGILPVPIPTPPPVITPPPPTFPTRPPLPEGITLYT